MSIYINPDIQYFPRSGVWFKPESAVRVDVVLQAGGGGAPAGLGWPGHKSGAHNGTNGEIIVRSIPAADLPSSMPVSIGQGGRPGGVAGYVLVVTHLNATASAHP